MMKKRNTMHFLSKSFIIIALTLTFFCHPFISSAQVAEDSIQQTAQSEKVKKGSIFSGRPGKSFLMSMVIPGAGQIYNKSYLRVPFVWGAVGGMGYLMIKNTQQYNCFREAYIDKVDGNPITMPGYCTPTIPLTEIDLILLTDQSPQTIRQLRDQANTNRQWSIVGFAAVWLLNGIDAFVDAHLKDFDIDEDLSIDIGPKMEDDPYAPMKMGVFVKF